MDIIIVKVFKTSSVVVCYLPQVDGLRVNNLIAFGVEKYEGESYFLRITLSNCKIGNRL